MKPDHKIRQEMYHRIATINDFDSQLKENTIINENISDDALIDLIYSHFIKDLNTIFKPAKSYFVGIIYSWLLQEHFDTLFFDNLNDKDLLYGNDLYFIPFKKAKHIYLEVLKRDIFPLNENISQVKSTIEYFNKEFLIKEMPIK